ncbi:cytidylyltransferase domain-containing protein [Pelotomaculum propionicicum]|uniref:acylneuraminate cytidylyltransferase family protein n=1 Tax=Pelotomaculum propionicicum TaxID=258475 RepID=UPI003B815C2C
MRNIAIIPARSGSKGLKDKNIMLLNGKPLMAYTIEAAIESRMFDEVFVSTDSEKYAEIAREYGASVPSLRSEDLSSDTASSWDVVKEALERYEEHGQFFDSFTLLQPTSPLRKVEDIVKAYNLFQERDANAIVGVTEAEHSPLWCGTLPEDQSLVGFFKSEHANQPRQKLEPYFRINGAIYIVKTDYFIKVKDIYESKCYAYVMSRETSIDIDTAFDFIIAGILAEHVMKGIQ